MEKDLSKFLHDSLDELQQVSSLDQYYHEFEAIRSLISSIQPWIPESYFTDRFIYGLCGEIQRYVIQFHPCATFDAYCLASIYEYERLPADKSYVVVDASTIMEGALQAQQYEGLDVMISDSSPLFNEPVSDDLVNPEDDISDDCPRLHSGERGHSEGINIAVSIVGALSPVGKCATYFPPAPLQNYSAFPIVNVPSCFVHVGHESMANLQSSLNSTYCHELFNCTRLNSQCLQLRSSFFQYPTFLWIF